MELVQLRSHPRRREAFQVLFDSICSRCRLFVAFTLIELLVVIAIISILAGLLLSALSSAKDRARLITDINNTHQILLATQMYAGDSDDFLPRPGWQVPYSCWAYGAPFPYAVDASAAGYATTDPAQLASVSQGQLYWYLKDARLYMCPGDRVNSRFYARQMYVSSYVWNGAVSAYDTTSSNTFKLAQFKPSNILQWESDENNPSTFNDAANYPYEGFTHRHGDIVTVGVIDGGAKRMKMTALDQLSGGLGAFPAPPTINPALLPNDLWCNPASPTGTMTQF